EEETGVGLTGRDEGVLDPEVDLDRRRAVSRVSEPAAAAARQGGRLGNLGQAEGGRVELPRAVFPAARHRDLDVVQSHCGPPRYLDVKIPQTAVQGSGRSLRRSSALRRSNALRRLDGLGQ